jgi:hypothetical protein
VSRHIRPLHHVLVLAPAPAGAVAPVPRQSPSPAVCRGRGRRSAARAQTHITVTALTAGAIVLTRAAGVAYFAAGALACSQSAKLVKMAVKQPRPRSAYSHKRTYGCAPLCT